MPTTLRRLLLSLALVSFAGCGAAPGDEEMQAQGGAAGELAAGGAAGAATPAGTGGAAGGRAGSAGATGGALGTGGSSSTGGARGTGGMVGTGGSTGKGGAGGAAVVEPPLCGPVGQFSTCIQRNPNKSGLKGGRWCALCDGRSVTQCTFVTPDKFDRDVACVTECTECDAWL